MFRISHLFSIYVIIGLTTSVFGHESSPEEWKRFKIKYGKSYPSLREEVLRRALFEERFEIVRAHNANNTNGFKLGLNQMSDWTAEERKQLVSLDREDEQLASANSIMLSTLTDKAADPDSLDWTHVEGVVTPVKNQLDCGACWAFVATGIMEGQQRLRNMSLVDLSNQNLVDCSHENLGCKGGSLVKALNFVHKQGGIVDEKSYPYTGVQDRCNFNRANIVMQVNGGTFVSKRNESELKSLVARYGPVGARIAASDLFLDYEGGVFDSPGCEDAQINHAVLIVGYGTDPDAGDYWLVKNSWGTYWGEAGYAKMARNKDNQCDIASTPVIAT